MIEFNETYCKLETDGKVLIQTWIGFANEDQFKTAILKSLELFKTGKYDSIVSDTQNSKVVPPKMLEWLNTDINPKLAQNGLRKMAFILPQSIVTKMGTDQFREKAQGQLEVQYFGSRDEALKWIK